MSIRDNLGGGSAAKVNVLDTLEEIEANTDPGKPAGALAVKELNQNIGSDENGMTVHEKLDYIMENAGSKHNSVTISLSYSNSAGSYVSESVTVEIGESGTFQLSKNTSGHTKDSFIVSWN